VVERFDAITTMRDPESNEFCVEPGPGDPHEAPGSLKGVDGLVLDPVDLLVDELRSLRGGGNGLDHGAYLDGDP
jgi:hypothetical protein